MGLRILEWGGNFHFSMSSNHEKKIWNILSYKLIPNESRVCKNLHNGFLFSSMMTTSEKEISYQNIMSSVFESNEIPTDFSTTIKDFPIYSMKELKNFKREDLREICQNFDIECPKLKKDIISLVYQTSKYSNLEGSRKKELIFKLNDNFFLRIIHFILSIGCISIMWTLLMLYIIRQKIPIIIQIGGSK